MLYATAALVRSATPCAAYQRRRFCSIPWLRIESTHRSITDNENPYSRTVNSTITYSMLFADGESAGSSPSSAGPLGRKLHDDHERVHAALIKRHAADAELSQVGPTC
jgi:hypothetical protein